MPASNADAQHDNGIKCAPCSRAIFLFRVMGRVHKCSLCKSLGRSPLRLLLSALSAQSAIISVGPSVTPVAVQFSIGNSSTSYRWTRYNAPADVKAPTWALTVTRWTGESLVKLKFAVRPQTTIVCGLCPGLLGVKLTSAAGNAGHPLTSHHMHATCP